MQKSNVLKAVALCMPILILTACTGHKRALKSDSSIVADSAYEQTIKSRLNVSEMLNDSVAVEIERTDYYYDTMRIAVPKAHIVVRIARNVNAKKQTNSDAMAVVSKIEHKETESRVEDKTEYKTKYTQLIMVAVAAFILLLVVIVWLIKKE